MSTYSRVASVVSSLCVTLTGAGARSFGGSGAPTAAEGIGHAWRRVLPAHASSKTAAFLARGRVLIPGRLLEDRGHVLTASARLAPRSQGLVRLLIATALATTFLLALTATPASAASIHIFSASFGAAGSGDGQLSLVASDRVTNAAGSGVAINQSTHDLYVADTGNARIDQFDSSGTFIRAWGFGVADGLPTLETCTLSCQAGTPGSGAGAFTTPVFIAVDNSSTSASQGDVYVGDTTTNLVTKFDASGSLISTWGTGGQLDGSTSTTPAGPFGGLAGIALDGSGNLFVYDQNANMFTFAEDGTPGTGFNSGVGVSPFGIAVDSAGNLYVVRGFPVIEKFTSSGTDIGTVTDDPDFQPPGATGLAVDPSTDALYVADSGAKIRYYPDTSCAASSSCQAADVFGSSDLSAAAGLAVDGSDHHVFAADTGHSRIADFAPAILPDASTFAATAIGPTSATLNGHLDPAGGPDTTDCHFDWGTDTTYGNTAPCAEGNAFSAPADVHADLTALTPGATYHYRLVVANPDGQTVGQDASFSTPPPPSIDAAAAQNLTTTEADLTVAINPNGLDTTYHFDWGTDATYGNTAPVPDGDLGSGTTDLPASTHLTGLTPNTTYHWRIVATNAAGTVGASVDHTFIYDTTGQGLPDNRAYEQVTPVHKNGASVGTQFLGLGPDLSDAGSRMVITATQCFADAASCPASRGQVGTSYAFDRTPAGWQPTALAPPAAQFDSNTAWAQSATAGTALFSAPSPPGGQDDWLARQPGGAFTDIGPLSPPADGPTLPPVSLQNKGLLATTDFSHLAWNFLTLWPFDATDPTHDSSAYQYGGAANSQPLLVGVSGGPGSTDLISTCGTGLPAQPGGMSADGRTLFFTAQNCASGSGANSGTPVPVDTIYARIDGDLPTAHTVPISERSPLDCTTPACTSSAPLVARFEGASADGSRVFFTSTQQLTDAATEDPQDSNGQCTATTGPNGCNLYLYDFSKPAGHRLTAVSVGDTSGQGPGVQGLMGISADGSHTYFLANGVLAPGASPGDCFLGNAGATGHCSLYDYDADTGDTAFIATLPTFRDSEQWDSFRTANITPDGRFLVFKSHAQLTPDDTSAPTTAQLFRYDAQTGGLARLSIGEHGFNDNGNTTGATACAPNVDVCPLDVAIARAAQLERVGPLRGDPTMSHDGTRVFFMSPLALTPQALDRVQTTATGGQGGVPSYAQNVYEWQQPGAGSCPASRTEGCVSLISDGRDTTGNNQPTCFQTGVVHSSVCLIGADATGDNVFFTTVDRLVPQDTDTQLDFYDARVGGGIPYTPPPEPCEGDACKPPPSATPAVPTAASVSFSGPGNATPGAAPATVKILSRVVHGSTFLVKISVPGKGRVTITGAGIRAVRKSVSKAGTYKLRVTLTAKERQLLRHKRRLKLKLRVSYAPTTGASSAVTFSITDKA